jgi:hypothetical protein
MALNVVPSSPSSSRRRTDTVALKSPAATLLGGADERLHRTARPAGQDDRAEEGQDQSRAPHGEQGTEEALVCRERLGQRTLKHDGDVVADALDSHHVRLARQLDHTIPADAGESALELLAVGAVERGRLHDEAGLLDGGRTTRAGS